MDFVDFCDVVLDKLIERRRSSLEAREMGQVVSQITTNVIEARSKGNDELNSIVLTALNELRKLGMVTKDRSGLLWRVSQVGIEYADDRTTVWQHLCSQRLDPDQERLLRIVNSLSQEPDSSYASVVWVDRDQILCNGWTESELLFSVARELEDLGLIACDARLGNYLRLHSTYSGLVWECKRGITVASMLIDGLVAEWETTSVDFKRELHLDTASQKAEFVKDLLGLVNTKSSGRRWLIIGFCDKTRGYHGQPDSKITLDRIEDLISRYSSPPIDVRYEVAQYRLGGVGKLEVLRNPTKLPYGVAQSIGERAAGDTKRIEKGQVFVRHGSRTVQATPEELDDLEQEAHRARSIANLPAKRS